MEEKKVCYYDSMSGLKTQDNVLLSNKRDHSTARRYLNGMLKFIADETKKNLKEPINASEWTLVLAATPQQGSFVNGLWEAGVNCGMFTILFADFLTDDVPFTFMNSDIPMFRRKVAAAIMRGSLDYNDEPAEVGEQEEEEEEPPSLNGYSESKLQKLMEIGFDQSSAMQALVANSDNEEAALNGLMSSEEGARLLSGMVIER
jgi:hypothetical protein